MSSRAALAIRIGALVLVAALLYWFVRGVDGPVLWRALHTADVWPLVVATALWVTSLFGKALVWRILLAPHDVRITRLVRYTIAAFAASALAPARAGELLRVLVLRQRDGVPIADSAGVAVTDKLLHAVTLLVIVAPVPFLLPMLPAWVGNSLIACAVVAAVLLVAAYIAVGRVEAHTPHTWFGRFVAGMRGVRRPRRLFAALGILAVVWAIDLLTMLAVLSAVDLEVSLAGALFILFVVNLAIAVPTTPANVGTLQLGALIATRLLGLPNEPALAFALLYHAVQIVPPLVLGVILEFRLVLPARAVR